MQKEFAQSHTMAKWHAGHEHRQGHPGACYGTPQSIDLICAHLAQLDEPSWPATLATGVDGVEMPLPVTIHLPDLLGAKAQGGIEQGCTLF